MVKIESPNKEYTGTVQGAAFHNGVAFAPGDSINLDWFRRKGYKVTADDNETDAVHAALKAEPASDAGLDNVGAPIEDAANSVHLTDEQRRQEYGEGVGQLLPPGVGSPSSAPVIGPSIVATERQLEQRAGKAGAKSTAKKATSRKSTRRKSTGRKAPARKTSGGGAKS